METRFVSGDSNFNNNDYIVSILKFKNGMLGKFSVNLGCVYPHFHRLSVYGTGATIENDYDYAKLYKMFDPSKEYELIKSEYPGVDKGDLIENFIDAIKNDKEPQISKKEIFNSMSICFAIEESMQTGKIKRFNTFIKTMKEIIGAKPFFGGKKEIDQILKNIEQVLKSGKLSLGDYTASFEEKMTKLVGSKYAVSVSSGGSALELTLQSLNLNGRGNCTY